MQPRMALLVANAKACGGKLELALQEQLGAGDNDQIVTEQKAPQGRDSATRNA